MVEGGPLFLLGLACQAFKASEKLRWPLGLGLARYEFGIFGGGLPLALLVDFA